MKSLLQNHGFSLVELLVVVSIVSILSVSAVLGFGYLGDTLRAREAAGFLQDTIRLEELKVLRGEVEKAVIHLLSDYLVIEERPEGSTNDLNLLKEECGEHDHKISFEKNGNLTKKNGEGEVLEVKGVTAGNECIGGFDTTKDLEWSFQLKTTDENKNSAILRFVHFNLQRGSLEDPLTIKSSVGYSIEIQAPYGKKRFYNQNDNPESTLRIGIGNSNAMETINLP